MKDPHNKTNIDSKRTASGLSLQQRLPLIMCVVLLTVTLAFSIASYYGVRKVSIDSGKSRLVNVTDELALMLSQSSQVVKTIVLKGAGQPSLKKFLETGGSTERDETLNNLQKLKRDSTWLLIELIGKNKAPILSFGSQSSAQKLPPDTILSEFVLRSDTCVLGRLYAVGDSVYFPVVATVTDKGNILGYLVCWRSVASNPQTVTQLSQLMGSGLTLYLGNADGALWTDFIKSCKKPVLQSKKNGNIFEYSNENQIPVYGAIKQIGGSPWLVLIEFSRKTVLIESNNFLKWIFVMGGVIIILGIFITWLIGRNIIRPLNQLTLASSAIAQGDYSVPVKVKRTDELGTLATTFNAMASQLRLTQEDLEKKVASRTAQLEKVNAELESFSYSVSHDLRAPLRSITGFSNILAEDYTNKLDGEAQRLLGVIKTNAEKMAALIDDLLAFAKLGRNEPVKISINSSEMVQEVIAILGARDNTIWHVQSLTDIYGEPNMIKQVWINLLSNAVKYSGKRQKSCIEVGCYEQGTMTVFFVKDNGVGFNQKYAANLFKVFQRLHTDTEFEGTGVGLAIVDKIVSKHGGSVWVQSEEDKGACFFFSIPKR